MPDVISYFQSLNIILHEVYSHSERTIDILPQILKIN